MAPRYLGLRVVLAKTFARIHWQNLVNFGVVPFRFVVPQAHDQLERGDRLSLSGHREPIRVGNPVRVGCSEKGLAFDVGHDLSTRQIEVLLAGGSINWVRRRLAGAAE